MNYNQYLMQVILPAATNAEVLNQSQKQPATIGDKVVRDICATTDTRAVLALTLHSNNVSPDGLFIFSRSQWDNLTYLYLGTNQVGNKGCKYLSRISFNSLDRLSLTNSQVGSAGTTHLSKAQWGCINKIELSSNFIRVDGVKELSRVNWAKLTRIQMTGNKMTLPEALQLMLLPTVMEEVNLADNQLGQWEKKKVKEWMKMKMPACSFEIEK